MTSPTTHWDDETGNANISSKFSSSSIQTNFEADKDDKHRSKNYKIFSRASLSNFPFPFFVVLFLFQEIRVYPAFVVKSKQCFEFTFSSETILVSIMAKTIYTWSISHTDMFVSEYPKLRCVVVTQSHKHHTHASA